MSDYIIHDGTLMSAELYHHGVKGMKWGVRRYQNKDGTLTEKGIKRYAKKAYAKESYESNQTTAGKVYDRISGAHRINADMRYEGSSKSQNKAAAEKYVAGRKSSVNKDYKAKQRKQDRAFYGKGGEKRINEKLNEGYGLRGARHLEAERKQRNAKMKKTAKKGAKAAASALTTAGLLYVQDQVFYGGIGTKAAKAAVKHIGRAAVSAYVYARGGRDIHWYDN